jgi:hypothetical protein
MMDTKTITKRFFIFLGKIENSNKWLVNDGNDSDFEVINETNDSDYEQGCLIAVRLRTEQTYIIEQKQLQAKYYVEEVLETYKSILEI